jgi:hypothetical protein
MSSCEGWVWRLINILRIVSRRPGACAASTDPGEGVGLRVGGRGVDCRQIDPVHAADEVRDLVVRAIAAGHVQARATEGT